MSLQNGPNGGEITLLRAPWGKDIMQKQSWEFYTGSDTKGPLRTPEQAKAKGVFVDKKNGVGWLMSASYLPEYQRFFIFTTNTKARSGRLGIHEAPTPYGPWHTVLYSVIENSALNVPPNSFFFNHLANSSKPGGLFTLIFSGSFAIDSINAVDATFTLSPAAKATSDAYFAGEAAE
jgi:hypothetical protein